jgi:hypothetical protein
MALFYKQLCIEGFIHWDIASIIHPRIKRDAVAYLD